MNEEKKLILPVYRFTCIYLKGSCADGLAFLVADTQFYKRLGPFVALVRWSVCVYQVKKSKNDFLWCRSWDCLCMRDGSVADGGECGTIWWFRVTCSSMIHTANDLFYNKWTHSRDPKICRHFLKYLEYSFLIHGFFVKEEL